jgi:hypothetical protein
MDTGTNMQLVVRRGIGWPNGLAVDTISELRHWFLTVSDVIIPLTCGAAVNYKTVDIECVECVTASLQ